MLGQMMVETGEGIVRDGIIRGRVVICGLETIFQNQIRAARPAKLKMFRQTCSQPGLETFRSTRRRT